MRASEHLMAAQRLIEIHPSPWREGLLEALNQCINACGFHEAESGWIMSDHYPAPAGPRTTALGHRPKQTVVEAKNVNTDEALQCLLEGD